MKIESVSSGTDRAGRYTVKLSDGTVMRLYRQTAEEFGVYSGMELTDREWENLRQAAGQISAKMRAVRIVSAASVSQKDLEQRLIHKGEDPAQAKEAVAWMSELELLDDRQTARQIVQRCAAKGLGLSRAKQALYEKQIPKDYWEEVLADYPDQTENIMDFLRARLRDAADSRQVKRVVEALMRRGHSYSQIRQCLRQLSLDDFREE